MRFVRCVPGLGLALAHTRGALNRDARYIKSFGLQIESIRCANIESIRCSNRIEAQHRNQREAFGIGQITGWSNGHRQ